MRSTARHQRLHPSVRCVVQDAAKLHCAALQAKGSQNMKVRGCSHAGAHPGGEGHGVCTAAQAVVPEADHSVQGPHVEHHPRADKVVEEQAVPHLHVDWHGWEGI